MERLRTLGVRYAQGFFLEEPAPLPLHRAVAAAG
jgi:EAL domain-containing protein (putative c-di-GMP-specific phosphodiesterase class I)